MANPITDLIKEIDGLISTIKKSGEAPSDELLALIDDISTDIDAIKEKEKAKSAQELLSKLDALIKTTTDGGNISETTAKNIIEAIHNIKIETPPPQVTVSPPKVNVTVPPIKVPGVTVPQTKVQFPDEIAVKKPSWIAGLFTLEPILGTLKEIRDKIVFETLPRDATDPVAVRLSDGEKFYRAVGGLAAAITSLFPFIKSDGKEKQALVDDDGHQQMDVLKIPETGINHLDNYSTSNVIYLGEEDKDGTYIITKIDLTGNFPVFTYATISNNPTLTTYTLAWDGRVTDTYNIFSTAF